MEYALVRAICSYTGSDQGGGKNPQETTFINFILEFYMKKIVAMLVAGLFSAGVFAQAAPAKKAEEPKKPAAAAPAEKAPAKK